MNKQSGGAEFRACLPKEQVLSFCRQGCGQGSAREIVHLGMKQLSMILISRAKPPVSLPAFARATAEAGGDFDRFFPHQLKSERAGSRKAGLSPISFLKRNGDPCGSR